MRVSRMLPLLLTVLVLLGACGRVETTGAPPGVAPAESTPAAGAPVGSTPAAGAPVGSTPATSGAPSAPTKVDASKIITTPSGLQYAELLEGTGAEATTGKTVSVHYTGWLTDGTKFDSSLDRGQPYDVKLGAGEVIKGWDEGLQGMKVGGKRQLIVPPTLGYGANANGPIPANATLIFEVQLVDVK